VLHLRWTQQMTTSGSSSSVGSIASTCASRTENYVFKCQFFEPAFEQKVIELSNHGTAEQLNNVLQKAKATIAWAMRRLKLLKAARHELELAILAKTVPLSDEEHLSTLTVQ